METFRTFIAFLSDYGVKSDNGVVVDTDHDHYAFQAPYILMPTIESSDITDPLLDESYYAIVPIARGLEVGNTDKDVNVTSFSQHQTRHIQRRQDTI